MSPPTFCAILPNYNDAQVCERALHSLIAQETRFDRIVVVDDGSTDDSLEVFKRIQQQAENLDIIVNPSNLGIMASVNIALRASAEDYVFFASANDMFGQRIVTLARQAIGNAEVGLIAGDTMLIAEDGTQTLRRAPLEAVVRCYDGKTYQELLRRRHFSFYGGSVFVHRRKALAAGGFREELLWSTDWFLFMLLATRHGFAYIPEVIGHLHLSPQQYSNALFDWRRQSTVVENYVQLLRNEYPAEYVMCRRLALLPSYDIQALRLFLMKPVLRDFLTPLLLWRLLSYKPLRLAGRLLGSGLRERLRGWFRV